MRLLVTGGAGYIGSHACVVLLEAGHDVVVLDNLSNGSRRALDRVEEITGRSLRFIEGDVRHPGDLASAFAAGVDAVIHFAALKAVGDSCVRPLDYFDNNICGTIALLRAMEAFGVTRLVFSSSATVYGNPDSLPVREDAPLRANSPYGRTKLVMEQLIQDWCEARPEVGVVLLRYFNPAGAHQSGRIGEDPSGEPNNLMPYIAQVAGGRLARLRVFGDDYSTRDGTGVRDYLHVMDVARAHLDAVAYAQANTGSEVFNIGTGRGYSVLEVIKAFEAASLTTIAREMLPRRKGDIAELTADPSRANRVLGWHAQHGLDQMCVDAWRWQVQNPQGYSE